MSQRIEDPEPNVPMLGAEMQFSACQTRGYGQKEAKTRRYARRRPREPPPKRVFWMLRRSPGSSEGAATSHKTWDGSTTGCHNPAGQYKNKKKKVIVREEGYTYIGALRSPDLRHTMKREGDTSVTVVTSNYCKSLRRSRRTWWRARDHGHKGDNKETMKRRRDLSDDDVVTPTNDPAFHVPLVKRYKDDAISRGEDMRMCVHAHLICAFEIFAVLAVATHTHSHTVSENTVASTTESSNDSNESVVSEDDETFVNGLLGLDTNFDHVDKVSDEYSASPVSFAQLDSGATKSVSSCSDLFSYIRLTPDVRIRVADGRELGGVIDNAIAPNNELIREAQFVQITNKFISGVRANNVHMHKC
jgi:hypothetical protein